MEYFMTQVSTLIKDAFRQSNLLALGGTPTLDQSDEALRMLNRIVASVYGYEAGEQLNHVNVHLDSDLKVLPSNPLFRLFHRAPLRISLPTKPQDGERFGLADPFGRLAEFPVTLVSPAGKIEGGEEITINTPSLHANWFYRGDLGEWVRNDALTLEGDFPFPIEFDDMFITMLAIRLNPAYGAQLDAQSNSVLIRSRSQFLARYHLTKEMAADYALISLSLADKDCQRSGYTGVDSFKRGY